MRSLLHHRAASIPTQGPLPLVLVALTSPSPTSGTLRMTTFFAAIAAAQVRQAASKRCVRRVTPLRIDAVSVLMTPRTPPRSPFCSAHMFADTAGRSSTLQTPFGGLLTSTWPRRYPTMMTPHKAPATATCELCLLLLVPSPPTFCLQMRLSQKRRKAVDTYLLSIWCNHTRTLVHGPARGTWRA